MSKGSADTRTPNLKAREETWERVWGKKKREDTLRDRINAAADCYDPEWDMTFIEKVDRAVTLEAWKNRLAEEAGKSTQEEALKRAGEPVAIFRSTELGDPVWVVSLEDSFWMDAFPTEEEAREFVEAVGWPVVE